jgi:small subunit ribosomal protein S18
MEFVVDQEGRRSQEEEGIEEEGEERGRSGFRRARVCQFCVDKTKSISYKNVDVLRALVSDRGKIRPRRQTGTCARHQREVAQAVKRARHMALLPFTGEMR